MPTEARGRVCQEAREAAVVTLTEALLLLVAEPGCQKASHPPGEAVSKSGSDPGAFIPGRGLWRSCLPRVVPFHVCSPR